MIPWLIVAQILSESGQTLSQLVGSVSACFRSAASSIFDSPMPKRPSARSALCAGAVVLDRTEACPRVADWRFNFAQLEYEPPDTAHVEGAGSMNLRAARPMSWWRYWKSQGAVAADH